MPTVHNVTDFESRECRRVRKLLDDFLTGELTVETNQEILAHLEHCPACRQEKNLREEVRRTVRSAWNSQVVPSGLEGKILNNLTGRRFSMTMFMRMAAGLLLVVLALSGSLLWLSSDHQSSLLDGVIDHYDQVVQDHLNCSGEPAPSGLPLPLDDVESDAVRALQAAGHPFQLIATNLCRLGDARFFHYVFGDSSGHLSLVLEQRSEGQRLSREGAEIERFINGMKAVCLRRGSVSLVSVESPNYFVYLASETSELQQTLELADGILSSLKVAL